MATAKKTVKKAVKKPVKKTVKKQPLFVAPKELVPGTVDAVLVTALTEVGYVEGPRENETKYGKEIGGNFHQWCGIFVNWVMKHAKVKMHNTWYTPSGAQGFKKKKQWFSWKSGQTPQPGDVIYFDFPGDGVDRISHVGICIKTLKDGSVLTVEGNTAGTTGDQRNGGMVLVKVRTKSQIVGWGRPNYKLMPIETQVNFKK